MIWPLALSLLKQSDVLCKPRRHLRRRVSRHRIWSWWPCWLLSQRSIDRRKHQLIQSTKREFRCSDFARLRFVPWREPGDLPADCGRLLFLSTRDSTIDSYPAANPWFLQILMLVTGYQFREDKLLSLFQFKCALLNRKNLGETTIVKTHARLRQRTTILDRDGRLVPATS